MGNSFTHTSPRLLTVLAALVWYIGAVALSIKGGALLAEAAALAPGSMWPGLAAGLAIAAGTLKAVLLFRKSCRKNLDRIARLEQPRIWQFYRPGFLVALILMIAAGAMMSRMAHGSFTPLLWVGGLDLSIAVALFGSSLEYWRQNSFART